MVKEDPLHRLSRTPTTASHQQEWAVWKEAERQRRQPIKEWGKAHTHSPTRKTVSSPAVHSTPPRETPAKVSTPVKTPVKTTTKTPKKTSASTPKKPIPIKTDKSSAAIPRKTSSSTTQKKTFSSRSPALTKTPTEVKSTLDAKNGTKEAAPFPSPNEAEATSTSGQSTPKAKNAAKQVATPPKSVQQIEIPDKKQAMELFDQLDENASGKLSLAELDKGVIILYPEFNNKPAIMAAYKAADRSGDGFVVREEFGYFLQYIVYYNNLWTVFAAIDDDNDRRISRNEFVAAAKKLDLPRNAEQVFAEIDANGGGMILFGELVEWMATNKSTWGSEEFEEMQKKLEDTKYVEDTKKEAKESPAAPPPAHPIPEAVKQIEIPDREKALKLFDRLDENASGKLSLAELDKGIISLFPEWNNKPAIMAAYKAADQSDDGFIKRKEFGYFLQYIVYYNNLWTVFAAVDDDGDRRISRNEFVAAAKKLDLPRNAEQVFAEIDANGGGMILFGELVEWMATNKSTWGSEEFEEMQKKLEDTKYVEDTKKEAKESPAAPPPAHPIPEAVKQIEIPDREKALKLFDRLDENASGKLSLAELDKGIISLFPEWNNKPAIMAAYKAADQSDDGFIKRKEFGYFLQYIVYYNNLWTVFAAVDDDGDRRISKDEFVAAADRLELERDAEQVFAEIDKNKGGMILFDELVHWMATNKSTWESYDTDLEEVQKQLEAMAL